MLFSDRWLDCPIQENKRWLIDHLSPSRTAMRKKQEHTRLAWEPTENPRKEAKKLSAIIQQRIWDILDFAGCTKFYVSSALRGLVGYYLNLANGLKGNYVNEKVFVVKYAINRQHFQ